MATTTNYSWTTPDDTDLVKDGAAAIRTLGSSIDTTTKNLNPSTTLGDIEYRSSSANTNTRLGIGSTGQVLTVAGGVPSWATAAAGSFVKINDTSFSAVSSISLPTNTFTSTYDHYKILFIVSSVDADAYYTARMRASGSDNTSAVYSSTFMDASHTGGATVGNGFGGATQTSWNSFGYGANGNPAYMSFDVLNPFNSVQTGYIGMSINQNAATYAIGGRFTNTTSFDSMTIFRASGNMTGKVTVFGYAK